MIKNYKKDYNVLVKKNNSIDYIECDVKELLKINPQLVINKEGIEIYRLNNIQSLYLYPLTVTDYINNIKDKNIIFINIINIDCSLDYREIFENKIFKYLKAVEILIDNRYDEKEIIKICDMIKYFYDRGICVSLNIKDLIIMSNSLNKYLKYVIYFKIYLSNILNDNLYNDFLLKLSDIRRLKSELSLVHIKTYLNIDKVLLYEKMIKDFSKFNVDIFQVSKELQPFGCDNKMVDTEIQNMVRNLESKYNSYNFTKFVSVKDLSTLFYPRFELDERNSRICYACRMKPYLYKNSILPCKVNKIFADLDNWSSIYFEHKKYSDIINKCGIQCDDCASIFENDFLSDIENIVSNNEFVNFCLIKE